MNIDKNEMSIAFANRDNPHYFNILMGHFEQFASYFASKFAINPSDRDDFKQEAMIVAFKALDKYDETKKSTPFSYFYKVFHTAFLYHLRKQKMKKDRQPRTCSIEAFADIKGQDDVFPEENFLSINDQIFEREDLVEKITEAKIFVKRIMKTYGKNCQKREIMKHEDQFIRDFSLRFLENNRVRVKNRKHNN